LRRNEFGSYFNVDKDGLITDVEIDPTRPQYENTSMEVFLLRKDLLMTWSTAARRTATTT
jgi:ADP-glucose pyrophosphorylase